MFDILFILMTTTYLYDDSYLWLGIMGNIIVTLRYYYIMNAFINAGDRADA